VGDINYLMEPGGSVAMVLNFVALPPLAITGHPASSRNSNSGNSLAANNMARGSCRLSANRFMQVVQHALLKMARTHARADMNLKTAEHLTPHHTLSNTLSGCGFDRLMTSGQDVSGWLCSAKHIRHKTQSHPSFTSFLGETLGNDFYSGDIIVLT